MMMKMIGEVLPFAAFRSVQRNPSPEKTIEFALSVLIVTLVNLFKDPTHVNDPILVVVEELGEEVVELVNLEESSINIKINHTCQHPYWNQDHPQHQDEHLERRELPLELVPIDRGVVGLRGKVQIRPEEDDEHIVGMMTTKQQQ